MHYRAIAEQLIGRALLADELVHHIDGDHSNDDPSNLLVCTKRWHWMIHRTKVRSIATLTIVHREDDPAQLSLFPVVGPSPLNIDCIECTNIPPRMPKLWTKKK